MTVGRALHRRLSSRWPHRRRRELVMLLPESGPAFCECRLWEIWHPELIRPVALPTDQLSGRRFRGRLIGRRGDATLPRRPPPFSRGPSSFVVLLARLASVLRSLRIGVELLQFVVSAKLPAKEAIVDSVDDSSLRDDRFQSLCLASTSRSHWQAAFAVGPIQTLSHRQAVSCSKPVRAVRVDGGRPLAKQARLECEPIGDH